MKRNQTNDCITIKGLMFYKVGEACPEQYEVFKGNKQVAYIKLRYGHLRAIYPNINGEVIYEKKYKEIYKGWFFDDEEKMVELNNIADCILKKLNERRRK